jgi:hypothetical protein
MLAIKRYINYKHQLAVAIAMRKREGGEFVRAGIYIGNS